MASRSYTVIARVQHLRPMVERLEFDLAVLDSFTRTVFTEVPLYVRRAVVLDSMYTPIVAHIPLHSQLPKEKRHLAYRRDIARFYADNPQRVNSAMAAAMKPAARSPELADLIDAFKFLEVIAKPSRQEPPPPQFSDAYEHVIHMYKTRHLVGPGLNEYMQRRAYNTTVDHSAVQTMVLALKAVSEKTAESRQALDAHVRLCDDVKRFSRCQVAKLSAPKHVQKAATLQQRHCVRITSASRHGARPSLSTVRAHRQV